MNQKTMLQKLEKNEKTIKQLREEILKIRTKSLFYKYLNEMEKEGYIKVKEDFVEITDTGKIILL
jgi:Mn-dependent DtxR family transcriptional regulator